jgi:hypothetical protein
MKCSVGYLLRAEGEADQVLAEPYEHIHTQTVAPYAPAATTSVLAWFDESSGFDVAAVGVSNVCRRARAAAR